MALWKGLPWENGENPSKKVSLSADLRWSESEMIQRGFSGTDRQIDGISSGIWKEKPGNTPFFVGGFSVFLWLFKSIHWFLGTWRLGSHIQKLNWESKSQRKIKMESQKKRTVSLAVPTEKPSCSKSFSVWCCVQCYFSFPRFIFVLSPLLDIEFLHQSMCLVDYSFKQDISSFRTTCVMHKDCFPCK